MSKRILLLLILPIVFISSAYAQKTVENIPNFDEQRWHWGYYFGANMYDFKLSPNAKGMTKGDALGIETSVFPGFTVGLIGDIRLNDYFNLRFEPGLDLSKRELFYNRDILQSYYDEGYLDPNLDPKSTFNDSIRKIKSTYINLPLLLKFGGKRRHNIRPFLIGGINIGIDLSSDENSKDNITGVFRMTTYNYSWQAGAGIDWYLPHFKFTTELRGSFGINNELVKDGTPPGSKSTPWTDPIDNLQTRAIFFVVKFE